MKNKRFVKIILLIVVIIMIISIYKATWKIISITTWKLIDDNWGAQGGIITIASEPLILNTPLISYILLIGVILVLCGGYIRKRKVACLITIIGIITIIGGFGILFWEQEIVSFQSKWTIFGDYKLERNIYPAIGFYILFIGFIIETYCALLSFKNN